MFLNIGIHEVAMGYYELYPKMTYVFVRSAGKWSLITAALIAQIQHGQDYKKQFIAPLVRS